LKNENRLDYIPKLVEKIMNLRYTYGTNNCKPTKHSIK